MKRALALLYFGVLAMGSIYAQGIEFFHGTYEEALQKARAEGKRMFLRVRRLVTIITISLFV